MVAIGTFCMAVRTFTGDIAVGQESLGFFVVILHGRFLDEFAFVIKLAEEVRSCLTVNV